MASVAKEAQTFLMARNAELDIFIGAEFRCRKRLTWKNDGLVIIPTCAPLQGLVDIHDYWRGGQRTEAIDAPATHLRWFSVYCNENTKFLDMHASVGELLVGELIYHIVERRLDAPSDGFLRLYIKMRSMGRLDDRSESASASTKDAQR